MPDRGNWPTDQSSAPNAPQNKRSKSRQSVGTTNPDELHTPPSPVEQALDALRHERLLGRAPQGVVRPTEIRETVDFLLALNTLPIARDAVCRLALARDTWLGAPATDKLAHVVGVSPKALERAARAAEQADQIAQEQRARAARHELSIVSIASADYPTALLDLALPPPILFVLSERPVDALAAAGISMVGPRRPDPWATEAARTLAQRFATAGLIVISGFARGIDAACHRGALESESGETVAVLGTGHGVDYPRGQHRLRMQIAARGAVISEFPPGTPPLPRHFPIRNRIIAALGWATLVVQASERSGSLITAREALDLGREVMALPGRPGDRRSVGSNRLLRDGARLVLGAREVLESVPTRVLEQLLAELARNEEIQVEGATPTADEPTRDERDRQVMDLVEATPLTAEELSHALGRPFIDVQAMLLRLELDGRLRRCPGARFLSTEPDLES